jgi:hypothetical protein
MRVQVEIKKKFLFTLEEEKTLIEKILFAEIIKKRERFKKNIVFKFFSLLSLSLLLINFVFFLAKKNESYEIFSLFFLYLNIYY